MNRCSLKNKAYFYKQQLLLLSFSQSNWDQIYFNSKPGSSFLIAANTAGNYSVLACFYKEFAYNLRALKFFLSLESIAAANCSDFAGDVSNSIFPALIYSFTWVISAWATMCKTAFFSLISKVGS